MHIDRIKVLFAELLFYYTDFVKKTQSLFDGESTDVAIQDEDEEERTYDPYTADDFLHDVFMDEERYNTLKALLLTKKNVILQGAPGVGKTFAAKRLAYSRKTRTASRWCNSIRVTATKTLSWASAPRKQASS